MKAKKGFSKSDLPEEEKKLWRNIDALCGEVLVLRNALVLISGTQTITRSREIARVALDRHAKMRDRRLKRGKGS
jgi:hypothetical protein